MFLKGISLAASPSLIFCGHSLLWTTELLPSLISPCFWSHSTYFPLLFSLTVFPLPLLVSQGFLSLLPFSFPNSLLGNLINFHYFFFTISGRVATKSEFLFLTTSFFFVSGMLIFHPSSLSNMPLPTFSG